MLLKCAEAQGKQVARVGYTEPPTYCTVVDDLQPAQVRYIEPYDSQLLENYEIVAGRLQPTEETTMQSLKRTGLVAAAMAVLPSMAFTAGSSSSVFGREVEPNFLPSPNIRNVKRKHHVRGGTHKQNLRASKRGGKQYKVRRAA